MSILKYTAGNYRSFLIYISLIVYEGFGFIPMLVGSGPKVSDYLLFSVFCIIIWATYYHKKILCVKNDPVGRIIIYILAYQFIIVLYSGFSGVDTWVNVLGFYRYSLVTLLYFVLRPIPICVYTSLISHLVKIISVASSMYIAFFLYQRTSPDVANPFHDTVLGIVPVLIFYLLFEELPKPIKTRRKCYLLLFALAFFFLGARFMTMAFMCCVVYYAIFIKKYKRYIFPSVILLILGPIIISAIDSTKKEAIDSKDIETELLIIKNSTDYFDYNQSSGVLRVMSVKERVEYMNQHPMNLLFGIGAMKESTAQDKLSFVSGTGGTLEEDGPRVNMQLDTTDVGLLSNFMRYGLCYIILFVVWMRYSFLRFKNNLKAPFMQAGYLITLMMLLSIPCADRYFYIWSFFPLLVVLGLSYQNSLPIRDIFKNRITCN
jgi:hypothetical protein